MFELWVMSDGRVWQVERRGLEFYVSSLLDTGGTSRIGSFIHESEIVLFAQQYLRLTVSEKLR